VVKFLESKLQKPALYETRKIQLMSPMLHIGSETSELSPFEYVVTPSYVYLPNKELLARELKRRGRLNDYIGAIERREPILNILEVAFGKDWQAYQVNDQHIFPRHLRSHNWVEDKIELLRPMIRNGFGQLYIPGSSIKGAIRTAIAYHLLKHANKYNVPRDTRVSQIEMRLRKSLGGLRQNARFYDDHSFMNELFTNFSLKGNLGSDRTGPGPNTDFMRAVHISDCEPLLERKVKKGNKKFIRNQAVVAEVIVSSHFPDNKAKYRASIYTECVFNIRTQFEITLDHDLLSKFEHKNQMQIPFKTVDDLISICQEFAQEQWDFEHDYWINIRNNYNSRDRKLDFDYIKNLYEPEQCPKTLRLGWGTGIAGTTVNTLIADDLRAEVRDVCGLKAPGFEAPKSRRTVVNRSGEIKYAPGWVGIKIL
jgi:CRISPR-associated protein Csm5